jgi:hypothetical protein
MNRSERLDDHQKFKVLAALALRGILSDNERIDLQRHLQQCVPCQQVHSEYSLISSEGMTYLAAAHGQVHESRDWDDRPTRNKLLARIQEAERSGIYDSKSRFPDVPVGVFVANGGARWAAVAIAACVLFAAAAGTYRLGTGARFNPSQPSLSAASVGVRNVVPQQPAPDDLITLRSEQLARLQAESAISLQELNRLRDALHIAEARSAALLAAKSEKDAEIRRLAEQRDTLAARLRDAQESYQLVQAELTSLRAEHDRTLLRATSLESKVEDLAAAAQEKERKLKDDEQYLASDRDIRELMGARKLYIADVFDVDSGSRTRKPFGRVFYTQNKSLIFYAFDLDHEPGFKNASAFQVWGKRDTEPTEKNRATNLGILYMDSESNKRWVLRLDDPKQLAEIDAVFVTVEPHGGSQKPTGKPFLYALLRKEANHP